MSAHVSPEIFVQASGPDEVSPVLRRVKEDGLARFCVAQQNYKDYNIEKEKKIPSLRATSLSHERRDLDRTTDVTQKQRILSRIYPLCTHAPFFFFFFSRSCQRRSKNPRKKNGPGQRNYHVNQCR